jgi:CMP-N,N'-diacetyllegionaminic acid synthase
MKISSLTLARGGSKGVPRKNITPLCGLPLVSYVISTSKASKIDETWVSTEDDEIAQIAESFGAQVIKRPPEMATDTARCEDALLHFAKYVDFDILVFIQTTSPMVTKDDINRGIALMQTGYYDSVFSVMKEHWIPRWTLDVKPIDWNTKYRPRRQSIEPKYVENGAFYITNKRNLLETGLRYSGKIGVIEMPFSRSFQVDTEDELKVIEALMRQGAMEGLENE